MTTLNDEILRATGGPTVNDGLLVFFKALNATSNDLMGAEAEALIDQGATAGQSIADMWLEILPGPGSLQDRQLVFWTAQP